jgi:hypothetical protein
MLLAIRAFFRAALPAAVGGFALWSVFEFSTRQSVGIACVLWFLIFSIQSRVLSDDFKPYALHVRVHLPVLFADLGLIDSPAGWSPYREKAKADGLDHEQFSIYAITPWLFATADRNEPYVRQFLFRRQIEQISVPLTPNSNPYAHRHPYIRFVRQKYWFVLQLMVPDDWEQELRARLPTAGVDAEYGEFDKIGVSVTLAAFPAQYLQHVIELHEPVSFFKPYWLWKRRDKRFLKSLKLKGWKREDDSPEYIEHTYISVGFQSEF